MSIHVNPLLNVKDSRWLQLEVCREFQRNKCTRSDSECKFAHPGPNVEIQNGRVIACYDSIKVSDKNWHDIEFIIIVVVSSSNVSTDFFLSSWFDWIGPM